MTDSSNASSILQQSVNILNLTSRARIILRGAAILTIGDLVQSTEDDILNLPSMGRKGLSEIKEMLHVRGLSLLEHGSSMEANKEINLTSCLEEIQVSLNNAKALLKLEQKTNEQTSVNQQGSMPGNRCELPKITIWSDSKHGARVTLNGDFTLANLEELVGYMKECK